MRVTMEDGEITHILPYWYLQWKGWFMLRPGGTPRVVFLPYISGVSVKLGYGIAELLLQTSRDVRGGVHHHGGQIPSPVKFGEWGTWLCY
jgi:hypothetical protein